ncbi:hypothetical protein [Vibrio metschnikovii]|uniref:Uncharacterized protein n=1 Tax=Vibrio metschnikovii TaxID=28172 RepID=A0A9X0R8C3_VIBME|nr:hypothetical protein [Vibrio metschnikovii]MBC5851382.1 hypothetical protein [Vibrio metschnikovii]
MKRHKYSSSHPSKRKEGGGFGKMLFLGGVATAVIVGSIAAIDSFSEKLKKEKEFERKFDYDLKNAKSELMSLDKEFVTQFNQIARNNVKDYYLSYWGVDKNGNRALVVAFHKNNKSILTLHKYTTKSLKEISPLSDEMKKFVEMDDKTQSPIYKKIIDGRMIFAEETKVTRLTDMNGILVNDNAEYNHSGSYNDGLHYLMHSNGSAYYSNNAAYKNKVKSVASQKLSSNRAAFSKSTARASAYGKGS